MTIKQTSQTFIRREREKRKEKQNAVCNNYIKLIWSEIMLSAYDFTFYPCGLGLRLGS